MEKSFTLMKIAAVAIIVAVVVAMSIMVTDGGKARFNKATRQLNSATSEFDNPALQAYDGATITGAEVIKVIDKYTSLTMPVRVKPSASTISNKYTKSYSDNIPSSMSKRINETAGFMGILCRDENNAITQLEFVQDGGYSSLHNYDGFYMTGSEVKQLQSDHPELIDNSIMMFDEHLPMMPIGGSWTLSSIPNDAKCAINTKVKDGEVVGLFIKVNYTGSF